MRCGIEAYSGRDIQISGDPKGDIREGGGVERSMAPVSDHLSGNGLLNVAWLCLSDVSRLRGRYSFGGKPTKPVIVRRSNGHNGEQIFGISAMWQLKILMAEVQQSAGQDFPRT